MANLPFHTRTDAGMQLSKELGEFRGARSTLILGLVRGGIVIGSTLAKELELPLYPYIVRKIGHPANREYAIGAIAENGSTYLDDTTMQASNVTWEDLEPVIEEEMQELKRRKQVYGIKRRPDLRGKTVILTDDGAATGATLFAAIRDVRKAAAKKIVVALPVCPPDTAAKVREQADTTIILATPASFMAVGQWYLDFPQVQDGEVLRLLEGKHIISP